jgi:hypothetical protein
VTRRPTLLELRRALLVELESLSRDNDSWSTPTEIADRLGLDHGIDWFKVALVLERLANDGYAQLQRPRSSVRRFRLKDEAAPRSVGEGVGR